MERWRRSLALGAWSVLALVSSGCGDASSPAGDAADAAVDLSAFLDREVSLDVPADVPVDVQVDIRGDAQPDAPSDVPGDVSADVEDASAPDVLPDLADSDVPDMAPDAVDVASDVADNAPDAADTAETAPDVAPVDAAQADVAPADVPDVYVLDPACPYDPAIVCLHWGVCAHGGAKVDCSGDTPTCDYADVAGYEEIEKSCDGLDNDCNNLIDDALKAPAASKQGGLCAGLLKECHGAQGWQDPPFAYVPFFEPVETLCDGVDNDCDGQVDNFPGPVSIPGAQGVCADVPMTCYGAAGWVAPDLTYLAFHEITETMCDGLDNDCDGLTDEGLETQNFYGSGVQVISQGVCGGAPIRCLAGVWSAPDYATVPEFEPVETLCDGLDNDCNGAVDDLTPLPASKTLGVCAGQVLVCAGAVGWKDPDWSLLPGYSDADDWTCDGLDNDCDGQTDEDAACPLWQLGGAGSGHLAITPDGTQVAWPFATGVQILDTQTGAHVRDWWGHSDAVDAVAFSSDGQWVASVGRTDVVEVWSRTPMPGPVTYAQSPTWSLTGVGIPFHAVAFSPDGGRLAIGDDQGVVRIYQVWNGQQVAGLLGHLAPVRALTWTPAGDQVLSGDDAGAVWRWTIAEKQGVQVAGLVTPVRSLVPMPGGAQVVVVSASQAQVLDATSGHVDALLAGVPLPLRAGTLRPDAGGQALLVDGLGQVQLYALPTPTDDSPTLGPVATWKPPASLVGQVAASVVAAGPHVVVGYPQRGPWRVGPQPAAWAPLTPRHDGGIRDADVAGDVLVTGGEDTAVRLWHAPTGQHLTDLWGHTAQVRAVLTLTTLPMGVGLPDLPALLGPGLWLVSGSSDFSVRLWSLTAGPAGVSVLNPKTLGLGGPWPEDLARTADVPGFWASGGPTLSKISADPSKLGQKLNAWPTKLGNIVQRVVPDPSGKWLAVGLTGDGPAKDVHYRVLDAQTLAVLHSWSDVPATTHAVAWSPDGARLALAGPDGTILVALAATGQVVQTLTGHTADVTALLWAPADQLVSTAEDGTVRLWRTSAPGPVTPGPVLTRHATVDLPLAVQGAVWLDVAAHRLGTFAADGAFTAWQVPVP